MGVKKIFISILATLIFFNIIFYVISLSGFLFYESDIVSVFLTLGVIAIGVSIAPIVDSEGPIVWFMSIIVICSILYQIKLTIPVIHVNLPPIGVGLVTRLTNLPVCSSDINSIWFMPFIFFHTLGLMGVISGILSISGGSE